MEERDGKQPGSDMYKISFANLQKGLQGQLGGYKDLLAEKEALFNKLSSNTKILIDENAIFMKNEIEMTQLR